MNEPVDEPLPDQARPDDLLSPGPVDRLDEAVDAWFEAHLRGNPVADRLFYTASALGDWAIIWHLVALGRMAVDHDRVGDGLGLSASLGVESLLVNQGIKRLFRRSRPTLERDHPHRLRQPSTSSFPSGHASSAFCAAVILTDQQPALAPLWFATAAVVASSRVHVKIHHASDVLGGAAVGVVLGMTAHAVLHRIGP